jgi:membrane protein implicated in regulation of membrane protease activity
VEDSIIYLMLVLGVVWILFELVEHLALPMYWAITGKKPRLHHGSAIIEGRLVHVVSWDGNQGKVRLDGELWQATGQQVFLPGDMAVVKKLKGLNLIVDRSKD